MTTVEYRILSPLSVEEYQRAQRYTSCKFSKEQTSKGEGVEFVECKPFVDHRGPGRYTHKRIHLGRRLPAWLRAFVPTDILKIDERSWNQYPYTRSFYSSPWLGDKFSVTVESVHVADRGTQENALNLDSETLKKRRVEVLDIAYSDTGDSKMSEEDPKTFVSKKTGRGKLQPEWWKTHVPILCTYKIVTVNVKYWLVGPTIENFLHKHLFRNVFLAGHRKAFCWIDEWWDLSMDDIQKLEDETKIELLKSLAAEGATEEASAAPVSMSPRK
jgi:hypothetical protein